MTVQNGPEGKTTVVALARTIADLNEEHASFFEVQLERALEQAAVDEWVEQTRALQGELFRLVARAEAIAALRSRRGRQLGQAAQEELRWVLERLAEVGRLLVEGLPDGQRSEYEKRFAGWL